MTRPTMASRGGEIVIAGMRAGGGKTRGRWWEEWSVRDPTYDGLWTKHGEHRKEPAQTGRAPASSQGIKRVIKTV